MLVDSHARWRDSMIASYPRPDKYATAEEYAVAEQEWRAKFDAGAQTLEIARAKVDEIINPIVPEQADVAIAKIDRFRIRKYGEEKHEEITKETVELVHAQQRPWNKLYGNLAKYEAARDDLKQKIEEAKQNGNTKEEARLTDELGVILRRIDDMRSPGDSASAARRAREKWAERNDWSDLVKRERSFELFANIFPDKNGTTFYSGNFRDSVVSESSSRGYGDQAKDAFSFLDMVAKCYNTSGKPFQRVAKFEFVADQGNAGEHNYEGPGLKPRIGMSPSFSSRGLLKPNEVANRKNFIGTFVHENGHYVVMDILGTSRENQNVAWLKSETKRDRISEYEWYQGAEKVEGYAPNEEDPAMLWAGYSYRVYDERRRQSWQPGRDDRYRPTELISTGLEALVTDADAFLRGFPKHANLLLDNLRGMK